MKRIALALLCCLGVSAQAAEPGATNAAAVPVLAVLAPTTGKQAAIGKRVVDLVSLAMEGSRIRLMVFDTAPSPTAAAEAAVAAGAAMVLGPVGAKETAEVAQALAPTRLTMLSLSGVSGGEAAPRRLRGRTSTADELSAICDRVASLDGARIGLIAPEGVEGDEAVSSFTGCLTERGTALHRLVRFASSQRDFVRVAQALEQGTVRPKRPEMPPKGWPSPPRAGSATAGGGARPTVLVAMASSAQAAALLPALAVRGWFDEPAPLRIFATGSWEGPELATAAAYLGDVRVVERCAWNDDREVARAFADRFEERFGEPPSRFDAEVFDAARMVEAGRRQLPAGVAVPEAWAAAMLGQSDVDGVCGALRWSEPGRLAHPLLFWSVDADGALFPRDAAWDD